MQRLEAKSVGFYLIWVCCFGIALIVLPYYLGSLIVRNNWQVMGLLVLGVAVSTLYFAEARYLILCTAVCFFFASSKISLISETLMTFRWVFLVTLSIRALVQWISGRVPTRLRGMDLWALSFITVVLYSQTYSLLPYVTLQRSVSVILLYLAVFWGVWNYAQDETRIPIVINDLLKSSFLFLVLGLLLIVKGRFAGLFASPNALGLFTALLMPLAVGNFLQERKPWLLYLVVLIGVNLILCGARTAILATAVGTGYVFWNHYRTKKHLMLTLLLFFLASAFLYLGLFDWSWLADYIRLGTLNTGSGRWEAWREVLRLIKLRPWLGYGFGTEDHLFYTFDIFFLEHSGAYAHNSYLGLISQLGLIGAFLLFAPLGFFLVRNSYQISRTSLQELHWFQPALTGSLLAGLVYAMFESWIYSVGSPFTFLFWVIVIFSYRLDSMPHPQKISR